MNESEDILKNAEEVFTEFVDAKSKAVKTIEELNNFIKKAQEIKDKIEESLKESGKIEKPDTRTSLSKRKSTKTTQSRKKKVEEKPVETPKENISPENNTEKIETFVNNSDENKGLDDTGFMDTSEDDIDDIFGDNGTIGF